jgi:predicted transcriptional regulator
MSEIKAAVASFSANRDLIARARLIATSEDRTFSAVVRAALREYVGKREQLRQLAEHEDAA